MDLLNFPTLMSFFLGIGLAAAAGFRVFLPLFVLSICAHFGAEYVNLGQEWAWVGGFPAMITLGVAMVAEILAYYIPWLDNILDTIAVPLAAIAGTILMASTLVDLSEVVTWALAIIAGGGTAATLSGTTAATRATSSATTGGTGNFVVSTGETATASVLSATSIIWAPVAFVLVIILLIAVVFAYKYFKKKKELIYAKFGWKT